LSKKILLSFLTIFSLGGFLAGYYIYDKYYNNKSHAQEEKPEIDLEKGIAVEEETELEQNQDLLEIIIEKEKSELDIENSIAVEEAEIPYERQGARQLEEHEVDFNPYIHGTGSP